VITADTAASCAVARTAARTTGRGDANRAHHTTAPATAVKIKQTTSSRTQSVAMTT
jgi:hypothetical protein